MKTHFFLTALILSTTSCCFNKGKDNHRIIYFNNLSDKILYIGYDNAYYPDSLYIFHGSSPSEWGNNEINPHEKLNDRALLTHRPTVNWEGKISEGKHGILMIFVFDEESLLKEGFDPDNYDKIVLQRYDLTLDDLNELKWTLSFPPTEEMKNIKMSPPYGYYKHLIASDRDKLDECYNE